MNLALSHSGRVKVDSITGAVKVRAIDQVDVALLEGLMKLGMTIITKVKGAKIITSIKFDEIKASFE